MATCPQIHQPVASSLLGYGVGPSLSGQFPYQHIQLQPFSVASHAQESGLELMQVSSLLLPQGQLPESQSSNPQAILPPQSLGERERANSCLPVCALNLSHQHNSLNFLTCSLCQPLSLSVMESEGISTEPHTGQTLRFFIEVVDLQCWVSFRYTTK